MNDDDLRDLFAFGAVLGQIINKGYVEPSRAYEIADAMIEAKYAKEEPEELGITAVKRKRKTTKEE